MAAVKKETLFGVVKHLLTLLNLLYGFNLGNPKPPGCVQKLRKRLHKHFVWHLFLLALFLYSYEKTNYNKSIFNTRWIYLINIFSCSFYLFAFSEPEMERLVRRLKRYQMGKLSGRATTRMIKVFLLTLAPVALTLTNILLNIVSLLFNAYVSEANIFKGMHLVFFESIFCLNAGIGLLFLLTVYLFPVLLSCLCCVLVSYCPSRLDDHVEDIRRAHSPLRKARLLSQLCHTYYHLQPLASMTNRNTAPTLSLMKIFTMLLWVISCHIFEEKHIERLFVLPILQYTIPLLMYLRMAPSANDMQLKIFTAAAEVLMVDDEWKLRNLFSRSLLIKMRLNFLQHLVHIRMDQGPFTLLGDSVDPETLFMIFVEANDLRTTLR